MKKNIATSITALALLAGAVTPAFAETAPVSGAASSTPNVTSKIACIGTAVNAREQSIGSAQTAYMTAVNAAYAARSAALQQAYMLTTTKEVRAAVKAAWAAFTKSARSARTDWRTSRDKAWSTYRIAARACKAPDGVSDAGNSGLEVTGN